MSEAIGVRFKENGKVYDFSPEGHIFEAGDRVVVETSRGIECGVVAAANREVDDALLAAPLKKIIRPATKADLELVAANEEKEKKAIGVCQGKIDKYRLDMHLVEVDYAFDGSKITFYYTAPSRVDFRELVKDLAGTFRSRIELRQIGARDESRMLGGLGLCGRPFCCKEFLNDFQPVSIRMAKEQGLSLNSAKISGSCGRLMCCLKFEEDSYKYLLKITPKVGALVMTKDGRGTVTDNNLLTGRLSVRLDSKPDAAPSTYNRDDVKIIKDAEIRVDKSELAALKDISGE